MIRSFLTLFFSSVLMAGLFPAQAQTEQTPTSETPPARLTNGVPDLDRFASLPVLYEGRTMPVDSFARVLLLEMSGREKVVDKNAKGDTVYSESAISWLARAFFHPASVETNQVFMIDHPEVLDAMGIGQNKGRRYSFRDLQPGGRKLAEFAMKANELPSEDRTIVDKEAMRVFGNLTRFLMLTHTFEFARPHPDFAFSDPAVLAELGLDDGRSMFSFLDVYRRLGAVREKVLAIASRPSTEWTPTEASLMGVSSRLFEWSRRFQGLPFHIVPASPHSDLDWVSPWDALNTSGQDPAMLQAAIELSRIANAYVIGDQTGFDAGISAYLQGVQSRYKPADLLWYTEKELAFNRASWFMRAKVFYIIAIMAAFASILAPNRWLRRGAVAILSLGLVFHLTGMVWRVVLTGFAPVTNLYTTFLFVGAVSVILGLFAERSQKNGIGLFTAAFVGATLLYVASRFALDGDTMKKVVAVLNSNFWLSTHVTTITMGYAGCWLAGIIAHVYLFIRIFKPAYHTLSRQVMRQMMGVLAFGLMFSFLGTFLGGIWADQSWGRFWGWDPKENGALLIVLWTALLYHARLGRMIGDNGLAAGVAVGNLVVMLAWLGVNLLSTGLHSYGFTSGLALKLGLYALAEIIIIAGLYTMVRHRNVT
jgi:ABC-type transport system involved in cytochrome c biogenesis permease subunit